jgi:hypothetical protein
LNTGMVEAKAEAKAGVKKESESETIEER